MQISFPAQSVAPLEPVSVLAEKTANNAAVSSTITRQEIAAQYFNPKITVDAPSGIVLLQYRAQNSDGTMRLQIPSETVVSHYKTYGYNSSNSPGTPVQAKSNDTAESSAPTPQAAAPVAEAPTPTPAPAPTVTAAPAPSPSGVSSIV